MKRRVRAFITTHKPVLLLLLALTWVYDLIVGRFFPNSHSGLGHDHGHGLPFLLDWYYGVQSSGLFTRQWFSPAWCGGVPIFAHPDAPLLSIPQLLTLVVAPLPATYLSILVSAALGFVGMYVLLRACFGIRPSAASLGATLFMFNGFFLHRSIIGHGGFAGIMLLPFVVACVLAPTIAPAVARRRTAAAALLTGYLALSHPAPLGLLCVLTVGLLLLLWRACSGQPLPLTRLALAFGLGTGIAASKLVAASALLRQFPRNDYPLPGIPSLWNNLQLWARLLFWRPDREDRRLFTNFRWSVMLHELEYSVTPIAAALLLVGAVMAARRLRGMKARHLARWLVFAVAATVPWVLNLYTPGWNAFLKNIPILASYSWVVRTWAAYIPLACILAAISLEGLPLARRAHQITAAVAIAGVCVWAWLQPRGYYDDQWYFPSATATAYANPGVAPPITRIGLQSPSAPSGGMQRNDTVADGVSQLACYYPLFGYELEKYPRGSLHQGSIWDTQEDTFNAKNPACYVFPEENHCRPGDHFRTDQRQELELFASRRPFAFAMPARQRLADAVSMLSLAGAIAMIVPWRRRVRLAQSPALDLSGRP